MMQILRPATIPPRKAPENAARGMLNRRGGGELTTKGHDDLARSKDTIPLGRDPVPPKDREH